MNCHNQHTKMDLLLSDEQKILQDSAVKLVERGAGPKRARKLRETETGFDRAFLREIGAAGWIGINVPENSGGLGLGMAELALVLEQAGRGLVSEPIAAAAASSRAIADGESEALRTTLLPKLISGEAIVVPALSESVGAVDLDRVATRAGAERDGAVRLTGRKICVPQAAGADGFIINAAADSGAVLCHVPKGAPGLEVAITRTVDGGGLGTLAFNGVRIEAENVIARANSAAALAHALNDTMLLLLGAEMLGVMGRALDIALDYLKIRKQFDRPIGSFQALQHRAVNDYIEVETTRSLVFQVAAAWDEGRGGSAIASAVKSKASGSVLAVAKSAIQMHGAIGFTDEHDIGLYLKRAMALASQYGNEAAHRARFARLSGLHPAS